MAPIWLSWVASSFAMQGSRLAADAPSSVAPNMADYLAAQWRNPSDILSVLMLIGPEVVRGAIAQLAGRAITPVAFSFGWVAYAPSALLSSFGDGRLMPESESTLMVIDSINGHSRQTRNWVLGRLWRDFNDRLDDKMKCESPHIPSEQGEPQEEAAPADLEFGRKRKGQEPFEALRITIYEIEESSTEKPIIHGVPCLDLVWFMGIVVIVVQLGIAAIPWAVNGQWETFLITVAGNLFAVSTASLPQWRSEKWATPKKGGQTVAITEGNGSRSVMVVLGKRGVGLNLEIMARGTRTAPAFLRTRIWNSVMAVLWVMLLITVAGMEENTWYLLGIGILGSIQNLVAASIPRSPAALGLHFKEKAIIKGRSVPQVLREAEEKYPLLGTALLDVFFPGSLRVRKEDTDNVTFWTKALRERHNENKHGNATVFSGRFDEKEIFALELRTGRTGKTSSLNLATTLLEAIGDVDTVSLRRLTDEAVAVIAAYMERMPRHAGNGFAIHVAPRPAEASAGDVVFAVAEEHYMLELLATPRAAEGLEESRRWGSDFVRALLATDEGNILPVTYINLTPPGRNTLENIFGDKFGTVMDLKRIYDPQDVFKLATPFSYIPATSQG